MIDRLNGITGSISGLGLYLVGFATESHTLQWGGLGVGISMAAVAAFKELRGWLDRPHNRHKFKEGAIDLPFGKQTISINTGKRPLSVAVFIIDGSGGPGSTGVVTVNNHGFDVTVDITSDTAELLWRAEVE